LLLERLRSSLEGRATVTEPWRAPEVPEPVFAEAEFHPVDGSEPQLSLLCIADDARAERLSDQARTLGAAESER
jgi:hypothetical protein